MSSEVRAAAGKRVRVSNFRPRWKATLSATFCAMGAKVE
jgi:hypothetical protein